MTMTDSTSDPRLKRLEALVQMALSRSALALTLANNVDAVAAATGAAAAVPYVAIAAPAITRKSSGKFLVTGYVTIDKNAGSLVAGDSVVLTPRVNAVELGSFVAPTAAVASGATVQAIVPFSFIASVAGSVAVGATATVDMQLTEAGGHTSSVLVDNGFISVIELPG